MERSREALAFRDRSTKNPDRLGEELHGLTERSAWCPRRARQRRVSACLRADAFDRIPIEG